MSAYARRPMISYPMKLADAQAVVLATAGYDRTIRFWEALSGVNYRTIQFPDSHINALAITQDKRFIAAAGNPSVRIFEVGSVHPNPNAVSVHEGHTGNVVACGFQRDGKWMYTGSEDGSIKVWDMRAPGPQRDYDHKGPVNTVVLHPNQGELISGDQNGSIKIWDLTNNQCMHELVPAEGVAIRSVSVASDGSYLAAANSKGQCYIWKMENGRDATELRPLVSLAAHKSYIIKVLLSPDARLMATAAADRTIKIWNTRDFSLERTLTGHQRWVWDCAFSADSAYLVSASSDHLARLWDVNQGDAIRDYAGHSKPIVAVALNDCGT